MSGYLFRRLFKQDRRAKLPRLMRGLRRDMDYQRIDDREVQLALMTGRFRDADHVARFMARHNVSTAAEVIPLLPPKPKVNWRRRAQRWLMSIEGSTPSDPYQHEWEAAQSGDRRIVPTYRMSDDE